MKGKMKQPDIDRYLNWLHHNDHFGMDAYRYDEKSLSLLDEFFNLIEQINPVSENGVRSVWLTAERGTFEDFGDVDEMIEFGDYDSKEQAFNDWKSTYPDEIAWYRLDAMEDKKEGYRVISLCHRCIILQDKKRELRGYETNITEFAEWLLFALKDVVEQLHNGTYNDYVKNNLPPQHRTGTILRKDFWDVWPEEREDFFKDISTEDVHEFVRLASAQGENYDSLDKYLGSMTANDFFRYCALGYAENKYDHCDLTPKEQYYKHADGRDEGLRDIDADSPEAFDNWLKNREHHGGHPWEVRSGGNSTHIDLRVYYNDKGYFLILAGKSWVRAVEVAHFYLALRRAEIPVFLLDAKALADRMSEKELIGIVPEGVFPRYCDSYFPNEHIITFMNLPYEDTEKFLPFCHWQPIDNVSLIKQAKKAQKNG